MWRVESKGIEIYVKSEGRTAYEMSQLTRPQEREILDSKAETEVRVQKGDIKTIKAFILELFKNKIKTRSCYWTQV